MSQILVFFCKLVVVALAKNCVKSLRVVKIDQQIKFEGTSGNLEAKNNHEQTRTTIDNHGQNI